MYDAFLNSGAPTTGHEGKSRGSGQGYVSKLKIKDRSIRSRREIPPATFIKNPDGNGAYYYFSRMRFYRKSSFMNKNIVMAVKFLGYIIAEHYRRKGIITRWKYAIDVKK